MSPDHPAVSAPRRRTRAAGSQSHQAGWRSGLPTRSQGSQASRAQRQRLRDDSRERGETRRGVEAEDRGLFPTPRLAKARAPPGLNGVWTRTGSRTDVSCNQCEAQVSGLCVPRARADSPSPSTSHSGHKGTANRPRKPNPPKIGGLDFPPVRKAQPGRPRSHFNRRQHARTPRQRRTPSLTLPISARRLARAR